MVTPAPHDASSCLPRAATLLDLALAAPTAALVARVYGRGAAGRYALALGGGLALQQAFLRVIQSAAGPEPASPADLLTYSRATTGSILAGLVASGVRDRAGAAGRLAWAGTLVAATASDWLDGPLARRAGPTWLGRALDIEADSWLTLWSAAAAVAWGDLPRWCLLPPLLRYGQPLLDLRDGRLPAGGGPGWSRVAGTAQMLLVAAALAPFRWPGRARLLARLAAPISAAQGATILVLLRRRWCGTDGH